VQSCKYENSGHRERRNRTRTCEDPLRISGKNKHILKCQATTPQRGAYDGRQTGAVRRTNQNSRFRETSSAELSNQHLFKYCSRATSEILCWSKERSKVEPFADWILMRFYWCSCATSPLMFHEPSKNIFYFTSYERKKSEYGYENTLKVRSHQKRYDFSRRPKHVSLLARPFAVFTP